MVTNKSLTVQGVEVGLTAKGDEDYISLTDMAGKFEGGAPLIDSWLRSKDTIEFLGVWERLNNQYFNPVEFDRIRLEAGTNRFTKRCTLAVADHGAWQIQIQR